MNSDIKKDWLKSLGSGNYIKGKGGLRRGNEYCCLGVLCEVIKDKYNLKWSEEIVNNAYHSVIYPENSKELMSTASYIRNSIAMDFGLRQGDQNELADINDLDDDWSEVIKYIKEKL